MFDVVYTNKFSKDLKGAHRRGKNLKKFDTVVGILTQGKTLDPKYRDHKLKGEYMGKRECHLEPDWLLIYEIDREKEQVILHEMGSHSDLF